MLASFAVASAQSTTGGQEPTAAPKAVAQDPAESELAPRTLHTPVISNDGAWMAAEERSDRGDRHVRVWSTESEVTFSIERGISPRIGRDSRWVSALLAPPLENARAGKPGNERAGQTLVLLDTKDGSRRTFDFVLSYDLTYFSAYLAYLQSPEAKTDGEEPTKELGTLHVVELEGDRVFTWQNVTEYAAHQQTTDPYAYVAFVSSDEDTGRDTLQVAVVGYAKVGWGTRATYDGENISGLSWAREPITLGFLDSTETSSTPYTWHVPANTVSGRFTRVDTPQ